MAPSPQESAVFDDGKSSPSSKPLTGEEVVISGMSGVFPKSNSTLEFMNNLFNKVDMVSEENPRWISNHPEVPKNIGIVDRMEKFDAQFFRVHYKQACTMEPMSRKLLEHAYSAIYDSGINPLQLRGKKVAVFIGSTFSESEKIVIYENVQRNGFGITGCNKAMYANRISYWIDGKGPSYALDVACASSMACLEHAYKCISTGQCDAAIVGGCNLCMHPSISLNMKRAGFLCTDGKTKCFDKNGDGYARSDAMSVLFLQRAKDAKRIYSEVYYAKGQYSSKPCTDWLPMYESEEIEKFLKDFYTEINVDPSEVEYVEANASAIAEADAKELEAIGKVFGKEKPVKIGSVKSNMGHSEPASGVCALTKVCLAYHKGQIPANLHYNEPLDIPAVQDGKVQVLKDHSPFNRGLTALNAFSYSGVYIHVLLKGHYKPKNLEKYKCSIPRLVFASGRQESCVKSMLETLKSQPIDPEQISLLHSIHESDIPGHTCRGYTLLDTNENNETVCLSEKFDYCSGVTRPIWFVYSGMGSQWAGMGAELMKMPIFAAAIQRCQKALEPKGIDLIRILTEPDKTIYDNILNSFVGIAAVQIGLTDILRELGIVPDNIIGHSVGELGCAYADGCFTAEEMILSAYSRGLVSVQEKFIRGSMAAIGLGYKDIAPLCPPEIEVACHNSSESATISGPSEVMREFVSELTAKGIFAKEVPCSNIAYHSRYIAKAGPNLRKYLTEVIKDPKPRSPKWVSTSVPEERWDEPLAKYSSAEYHTNNLLSPVLFEETAKQIPENAILIEIAPHGLLQAILKRSHTGCSHVPLTRRGHAAPIQVFLDAIGKLYQEGLNPKVENLYPKIQFPVSTETPLLAQIVEWEHSENWPTAKYFAKDRVITPCREFVMSIHDDDSKYLEGQLRDGNLAFPEAAQLVLVWESLAMSKLMDYRDLSVQFTNVQFHNEALIKREEPFKLHIMIHKGNKQFEVSHNRVTIATGTIVETESKNAVTLRDFDDKITENDVFLTSEDIYKIMNLRGHTYKNDFQSIHSTNMKCDKANIKWADEWVTFLDGLLQLNAFARDYNGISTPKIIKRLTINTVEHKKVIAETSDGILPAQLFSVYETTRCGGVELFSIVFNDKPVVEKEPDVLGTGSFIPHFLTGDVDINTALLINLQIIADNAAKDKLKVVEIVTDSIPIVDIINDVVKGVPTVEFEVQSLHARTVGFKESEKIVNCDVFVVTNLLQNTEKLLTLQNVLSDKAFVLTIETNPSKIDTKQSQFIVISGMMVQGKKLILLKKTDFAQNENIVYIPIVHDGNFSWVSRVQTEIQKTRRVILVSQGQTYCGLLGFVKRLNKEYGNKIGLVAIDDANATSFDPKVDNYKEQLRKNLVINVFRKNHWGGYYYLPSSKAITTKNVKLINSELGNIDSLTWSETASVENKTCNTVEVYFAGPSYRDAQKAVMESECNYGMDFSGIDFKGRKVMGLVAEGALAGTVEADPNMLWPVPEHWTLEDAATVPLPYAHAFYCLTLKYPIIRNRAVFINGGAGALGQAIISICIALNCKVFTTVSDIHKKRFLLRLFPELEGDNIGFSGSDSFKDTVLLNTKGKGCNYVINCLSGKMREAAMKVVAFSGIFIDINDYDMKNNEDFGMAYLCEERNYMAVNVANLFRRENIAERKSIRDMIALGISNGTVRPISRVVYSPKDVTRAFRLLAMSKHRGRVLIKMREPVNMSQGLLAKPKMNYSSTASYIVVCDESVVGVELADYLVRHGVKNLIVHIRPAYMNGYFDSRLESWKSRGINVIISSDLLQTEKGTVKILKEGEKLGPIQGIFIGVASEPQLVGDFASRFDETALVVGNLDLISRNYCKELRHFVVLTHESRSPVEEYMASVCDKICQARSDVGLPALLFRSKLIDVLSLESDKSHFKVQPQKLTTVFNALEVSMKLNYNNVLTYDLNDKSSADTLNKIAKILGVERLDGVPDNLTLASLSLTNIGIEEIRTVLKEKFQINVPLDKIQNITVANLKEMTKSDGVNLRSLTGLGTFIRFIDEDECLASEPIINMPTKLSNATEGEEEQDPTATYMMLVPGFEGHHHIFHTISERLKIPAMTFQLVPDMTNAGIKEIAQDILKNMKKRFDLKSNFHLLGYSFGVNVVLELAALLEKEGLTGKVYCLDSSPDALRVQLDMSLGNQTEKQLQNTIIEHMYQLMSGKEMDDLKVELDHIEHWSDKVDACVNKLRDVMIYSRQYKRSLLEQAYNRINLAKEYKPDFILDSQIVLMKGIADPKAEFADDYGLSKYSKQPVKVFNLESVHDLTPYDCRVSNIINRLLEPALIENFKQMNLCESYLADQAKSF